MTSSPMELALSLARRAAATTLPVLITGENGSGKGWLARQIHELGPRQSRPYVVVNMSAVPESLFAAELFGVEAGAYTDADARVGHFERAADGTLVLDEIADLALASQAALLRVLQNRSVTRVGGHREIPVKARIVAVTSADLMDRIAERRFREDLFHRLAIVCLRVPALRERGADLGALVSHLLIEGREKWGIPGDVTVAPDAIQALGEYEWPGNVRELQNVLARLAMSMTRGVIGKADVMRALGTSDSAKERRPPTLHESVERAMQSAFEATAGDPTKMASGLGISRATVYRWLQRIQKPERQLRGAS